MKVIDALAIDKEEDDLKQGGVTIKIAGTTIGQDKNTQITTIITGQKISMRREVNQSARVDLDGSESYTIIFIQDGISNTVKINGGGDSVITIRQSD